MLNIFYPPPRSRSFHCKVTAHAPVCLCVYAVREQIGGRGCARMPLCFLCLCLPVCLYVCLSVSLARSLSPSHYYVCKLYESSLYGVIKYFCLKPKNLHAKQMIKTANVLGIRLNHILFQNRDPMRPLKIASSGTVAERCE